MDNMILLILLSFRVVATPRAALEGSAADAPGPGATGGRGAPLAFGTFG